MNTYYVSSSLGNDSNSGLSESTPWASIAKVNAAITAGSFRNGDKILFKCNDVFYGNLNVPNMTSPAAWASGLAVTYSSYGKGKKPQICGYKVANGTSSWVLTATPNVWQMDLKDTSKFTGNTVSTDANVGFLKLDGVIFGDKKWNLTDIISQWQFYSDGTQYLYVYSVGNPSSLKSKIEISVNGNLITLGTNTNIYNLEFIGSGGHGLRGVAVNTKISNCEIHEIGGSQLVGQGNLRYGNGVELWVDSKNTLVEGNKIHDCYDVGYTLQGNMASAVFGWDTCVFRGNTEWNNSQSFEVWSDGNSTDGKGHKNCLFENNICLSVGGWGGDVRPDKQRVHLLVYQMLSQYNDIKIRNNVFVGGIEGQYYVSGGVFPTNYITENNFVFLNSGKKIMNNTGSPTIEDYQTFVSTYNRDNGSQFFILPNANQQMEDIMAVILSQLGSAIGQSIVMQNSINQIAGKLNETIEQARDKEKCKMRNSADYSIPDSLETTLSFNSEDFDTNEMHSTSTNNSTVTISQGGYYLIRLQVTFASNATGIRKIALFANGTRIVENTAPAINGNTTQMEVCDVFALTPSATITAKAYQNSGAALNVTSFNTTLSVTKID